MNTPLEEIEQSCASYSPTEYFLAPELEDGRIIRFRCAKNCTAETAYRGIGITYVYSRAHLENWRDIDAKVFAILDSYTKPFNVDIRESSNGVPL